MSVQFSVRVRNARLESAAAGTYDCGVRAMFSDSEDAELVLTLEIVE